MSADGQGELEPEVPRKNVVGLFCGAAFHDVVFARVSGRLLLRVRRVGVVVVAEQRSRSFVPGHVTLADCVITNRTCDSRVHARHGGEVLPVDLSAAQQELLEVAAHELTGHGLELVGLVDLAGVV